MTELIEHRERVKVAVEKYLDRNAEQARVLHLALVEDAREHIINIGTSILMTRWGIGPSGGSFVQAIVDNDLREAFGRADEINEQAIKFYLMLIYNQNYVY